VANASLTWLGHAAFRLDSAQGKRIYVDPFLNGNPSCPEAERDPAHVDVIVVTHGHVDHVGDAVALAQQHRSQIVAQVELKGWLGAQGAPVGEVPGLNKGGSQEIDGIRYSLVNAFHSSSSPDGAYLGESCGVVIRLEDGKTVYFAGDTCVFGDMQLIGRIYRPDVACLPIGDHFTMGPEEAAVALELLGVERCVPCHYGTFPILAGTPARLRELAPASVETVELQPGESLTL
jgi:L-ascorbate metabolism protein UlaG (beta-lactamase superfamily)